MLELRNWRSGEVIGRLETDHLPAAELSGRDLSWADLRGADLSGADLRGAGLAGADLRQADLAGVDLRRAEYDPRTRWPEGLSAASAGARLPPFPIPRVAPCEVFLVPPPAVFPADR